MHNKSSFTLTTTHKFCVNTGTASKPYQNGESDTYASTDGSLLTSYIGKTGGLAGIVTANKNSTKAVLEHYKSNAAYSHLSALMSDLHTAWGLN